MAFSQVPQRVIIDLEIKKYPEQNLKKKCIQHGTFKKLF